MESVTCYFCIKPPINYCLCVKNPLCKYHHRLYSQPIRNKLCQINLGILNLNPIKSFLKNDESMKMPIKATYYEYMNKISSKISGYTGVPLDPFSQTIIEMKFCNDSKILAILDILNNLTILKLSDDLKAIEKCLKRFEIQNIRSNLVRHINPFVFMSSKHKFICFFQGYDINVWYFNNDTKLIKTDLLYNHKQKLSLSNNEDFLIILNTDTIKVLDLKDFSTVSVINSTFDPGFCFMTSNNYIYVSSKFDESLLHIYDINGPSLIQYLKLPYQNTSCSVLSRNEEMFASGFKNKKICVWSIPVNDEYFSLEGHNETIKFLIFTNNSLKLISGGIDDFINIWDLKSKMLFKRIDIEYGCFFLEVLDDTRFIVNGFNNDLKIYDFSRDFVDEIFDKHFDEVSAVCFAKSFKFLATGGHDHKILVWKTQDWSYVSRKNAHEFCISAICFSRDENYLFSASERSRIHMWDRETVTLQRYFLCGESRISELLVNQDDKVLVAGYDNNIKFFK